MPLQKFLTEIADLSQTVEASGLLLLSGLLPQEMAEVRPAWQAVPDSRRHEVVSRLVEMAEENADLDFYAFLCVSTEDPSPLVRERALAGLWEIDDRSIIPLLVTALAKDTDDVVRATAATVLGRFATLAQNGKLLDRDANRVYDALLTAVRATHEPVGVRRRALESLGAFESGEVRQWVTWGYQSQESGLRQSALHAMGRSCDSSWLPVICSELGNDDPAMRFEAANACRELGEDEAVPHLASLMHDDDLEVQLSAIQALGAIGSGRAKKLLRQCVAGAGGDDVVREAAEAALETMEWEAAPLHFKPVR